MQLRQTIRSAVSITMGYTSTSLTSGKRMRIIFKAFAMLIIFGGVSAGAEGISYISAEEVDLPKILAPPPRPDSAQQKVDLAIVLQAQQSRTATGADRAIADNDLSMFRIAGEILGPNFNSSQVPKTAAFLDRINQDARSLFLASKEVWVRQRPFKVSTEVNPVGELPKTGSYPSGHATRGYLMAIILADMIPEKRELLFERGREYGQNRVLAGVHFPSDIEAGRVAASVIAEALYQKLTFKKDLAEARSELRGALGNH